MGWERIVETFVCTPKVQKIEWKNHGGILEIMYTTSLRQDELSEFRWDNHSF
jgi:hypothetical protein